MRTSDLTASVLCIVLFPPSVTLQAATLAIIGIKSRSFIVIYCFVHESKGYAEEFPLHRHVNKSIVVAL